MFYSQPQIKAFTDSRHLEELYNRYKGKFYIHFIITFSFCTLVKSSETVVKELLVFYEHGNNKVSCLKWADSYVDMILADGISLLCDDLQVVDLCVQLFFMCWWVDGYKFFYLILTMQFYFLRLPIVMWIAFLLQVDPQDIVMVCSSKIISATQGICI